MHPQVSVFCILYLYFVFCFLYFVSVFCRQVNLTRRTTVHVGAMCVVPFSATVDSSYSVVCGDGLFLFNGPECPFLNYEEAHFTVLSLCCDYPNPAGTGCVMRGCGCPLIFHTDHKNTLTLIRARFLAVSQTQPERKPIYVKTCMLCAPPLKTANSWSLLTFQ